MNVQSAAASDGPYSSSRQNGSDLTLVFGMPRSGTTWLGKIFDSHPDTLYRHEPDSFGRLNFMPIAPDPSEAESWRTELETFIAGLAEVADTKVAATLPQFPKSYLGYPSQLWNAAAIRLAKLQARLTGEARARLLRPGPNEARLVWKSIESVARLGTISHLLPDARGVLIVRHPCGYAASVARGKRLRQFTDGDSVGEDLGLLELLCDTPTGEHYGIDVQRLRHMQPIERLAWQWVLSNDKALAEIEHHERICAVTYEELCSAPLPTVRRLFSHTELTVTEQTERFLEASTSHHHDRYYGVYKDPSRTALGWQDELPADVQRTIARVTSDTRSGALFGS